MVMHLQLPPNAGYGPDGLLYHEVEKVTEGGTKVKVRRRLAMTLDEARDKRLDFYHPTLGLIWEGFKLGADRPMESILHDETLGGLTPPGEVPIPTLGLAPAKD